MSTIVLAHGVLGFGELRMAPLTTSMTAEDLSSGAPAF